MLKSPMIYASLFSAEIFGVISDSLSTNKSNYDFFLRLSVLQ